ncbi:hexokinase family protein SCDLUD_002238 [Saccharomycodes ludwigii]|nr:hypothetical protein SCDLUD_002238 [Saccharomycodes ludwigii]KAH3902416.1 hypothetical protein SCDLUD_002238 [Saccharomycodes ludwigii]
MGTYEVLFNDIIEDKGNFLNDSKSDLIVVSSNSIVEAEDKEYEPLKLLTEFNHIPNKNALTYYLNKYFHIAELQQNFDEIVLEFKEDMFDAIYKSYNSMRPFFNVVPNQEVNGTCFVIDIGGSTLRISMVELSFNYQINCILSESWCIADDNKVIDKDWLKWIISKFKGFLQTLKIKHKVDLSNNNGKFKVGITWSFPMVQKDASNRGEISDLGKGFEVCQEYFGGDLKDIFENNFREEGLDIDVGSIVNDSIAVFVTGAYLVKSKLALVLGTGLNSCFAINNSLFGQHKRLPLSVNSPSDKVLVNAESSFFGYNLQKYVTDIDKQMCAFWNLNYEQYLPPHLTTDQYGVFQPLELLTAGRYIPEIIRLTIAKVFAECSFVIPSLFTKGKYCCDAEFFAKLYIDVNQVSGLKPDKYELVKDIIDVVIKRASLILAMYIIALLQLAEATTSATSARETVYISVVGSMLKYFPGYKGKVEGYLNFYCKRLNLPKVEFIFLENSSIYGASISCF